MIGSAHFDRGYPETFTDSRNLGIPVTRDEMAWAMATQYVIPAFRDSTKPTVEMLLDHVDLVLDWYIPSEEAFDLVNFIRLCIGGEPENLNSLPQYFFIDSILGSFDAILPYFAVRGIDISDMEINTLIMSTREFSKSTIINYFILKMAYDGKVKRMGDKRINFGMYISDKIDNGNVKITMNKLRDFVLTSDYLRSRFEWTHFTNSSFSVIRKPVEENEIREYNKAKSKGLKDSEVPNRNSRKFTVNGLGSSGGRGASDFLSRPQFAIFDDLIGNETDAYSKPYLDGVEKTINSDIGKSMSKAGYFNIFIGTIFHTEDPLYKRATSGYHLPIVFPAAQEPPHSGVYDNNGVMIKPPMTKDKFISVWSDRHTFEAQKIEFRMAEIALANGDPKPMRSTMQEFYLRVISDNERLIPANNIQWCNMDKIIRNAHLYTWLLATDLTTTGNPSSDDSGQFMWAIDWEENFYLVRLTLKKQHLNVQTKNIFDMVKEALTWGANIVEIAVEIDGQQNLHIMNLEKYARENGYLHLLNFAVQRSNDGKKVAHVGIRAKSNGDKHERLKPFAELFFNQNKVFLNEEYKSGYADMTTYLEEIRLTTFTEIKAPSDNGLDCTSITQLCEYHIPMMPELEEYNPIGIDITGNDDYWSLMSKASHQDKNEYNNIMDLYK